MGLNNSAISQAKTRNSIPLGWVVVLSEKLDLNPQWIKTGVGKKDLRDLSDENDFEAVPKVKARLSAGGGSFDVKSDIEGFYSFQKKWLRQKGRSQKMVLVDIVGNSMEPELKNGDTVLVDQSQNEILAGAIYAVGIDDIIMVKRIEKLPDTLVLRSENKDYPPTHLHGEEVNRVRILGKVIWVCREIN